MIITSSGFRSMVSATAGRLNRRNISFLIKGVIFVGCLYHYSGFWPYMLPAASQVWLEGGSFSPGQSVFRLVLSVLLLGLPTALLAWLMAGKCFSRVRRLLRPLWVPLAISWLSVLVGYLFMCSIKGMWKYGFPLPDDDYGGPYDPWPLFFEGSLPLASSMWVCVVSSRLAMIRLGGGWKKIAGLWPLLAFTIICILSAHEAAVFFTASSTWLDEEIYELVCSYAWLFVLWFAPTLIMVYVFLREPPGEPAG